MSKFDPIMKALQQLDAKLDKLTRASPEVVASARLLRAFLNQAGPPKVAGQKRKRGRPPKNGKDNSDPRSFEVRLAKAREMNASPKLMSIPEAATVIRVGRSKMWQMVWTGEIKSVFVGRQRRVVVESLNKYIKDAQKKA